MRALSDLASRGLKTTSSALAQSADHVRSFFEMLRAELGFYLSCLNLRERLTVKGSQFFPDPGSPVPGWHRARPAVAPADCTTRPWR